MSETLDLSEPTEWSTAIDAAAETAGKVTLLQELAEPVEFLSADRSNRSTPPMNTDFDDQ